MLTYAFGSEKDPIPDDGTDGVHDLSLSSVTPMDLYPIKSTRGINLERVYAQESKQT
jgi:hypothetical protein